MQHALLGPSGASKWINCTPSVRAEQEVPDQGSSYADEGSRAHECAEIVATQELFDLEAARALAKRIHGKDHLFPPGRYDGDMMAAAVTWAAEIKKITTPLDLAGVPYVVNLERRVDISRWTVPGQFGTSDCTVVSPDHAWVPDFKYGKGVAIEVESNEQLKFYALGALKDVVPLPKVVTIGVVQPRMGNIRYQEIPIQDLLAWGEAIRPLAVKAWNGEGEFNPGPHCVKGFCRIRNTCRARAEYMLAAAANMPPSPTLSVAEVDALLPKLEGIVSWANGLQAYAETEAIAGTQYPNFKLVEGRSNRRIADQEAAARYLIERGWRFKQILKPRELLALGDLEKVLGGAKKFAEILGKPNQEIQFERAGETLTKVFVTKPKGKPTLVPKTDPREPWRDGSSAVEDFEACEP